jgi:hypothetical protein
MIAHTARNHVASSSDQPSASFECARNPSVTVAIETSQTSIF